MQTLSFSSVIKSDSELGEIKGKIFKEKIFLGKNKAELMESSK